MRCSSFEKLTKLLWQRVPDAVHMGRSRALILILPLIVVALRAQAAELPEFDFTKAAIGSEWKAAHHIQTLRPVPEGLEITINGSDPFAEGPARDYPAGVPLCLTLRLKSEAGGIGQVFYFREHASEENSSLFSVKPGAWTDVKLMLPALGPGYRLRIDPPGSRGRTVITFLRFERAASLPSPQWLPHGTADFSRVLGLDSGSLELQVAPGGFRVTVGGQRMAASHARPMLGYVLKDQVRWLDLGQPALVSKRGRGIEARLILRDPDGATWKLGQRFTAGTRDGVINFNVSVETDQDREVAFLPMLLLVASEGSTNKGQAVFPGLEYLENEPSSSEADLVGPQSRRQVPANHKLTFPLMAIQNDGRYVGIIWEHGPQFSAVFDSPDRVFGTAGHVMGVLFPGSDGFNRHEGEVMPIRAQTLRTGRKLELSAQIIGGLGASVVPAIQQYVKLRGLPPLPPSGYTFNEYVAFAAHGWLDSDIREGNLFRHAVFGDNFKAQPSADAALYLNWLAGHAGAPELRGRLEAASRGALSAVSPGQFDTALIGHVRQPVQSLVFGHVGESAALQGRHAQALLRRFRPDGTVAYQTRPNGVDYGRTHFADHANGLSAQVLATALEGAMFAGDHSLIEDAIRTLRQMKRAYAHGVPRGAQTWEVPLHTPDILASAHLVRAFTMGFQLTGDREFLDEAIYWAWTGLPFLYLVNPVGTADLPYGCVTVFGATAWQAPVWIGRPVQWCGLVYSDALYRLVPYDSSGPWKRIADGITATGIRYSWPRDDKERQGLLPDGWEVLGLNRVDPPINPGTVQANAVNLYGKGPLYDCRVLRINKARIIVHAPGEIVPAMAAGNRVVFKVWAWPNKPYSVLLNGFDSAPQVRVNGRSVPLTEPHQFHAGDGRLVLKLSGQPTVEITPMAKANQP